MCAYLLHYTNHAPTTISYPYLQPSRLGRSRYAAILEQVAAQLPSHDLLLLPLLEAQKAATAYSERYRERDGAVKQIVPRSVVDGTLGVLGMGMTHTF